MGLRTFCEDLAIDVRGCLACAIVSSETGVLLATYVVPGSTIGSGAMELLAAATVEYFGTDILPQKDDTKVGRTSATSVDSIQIITEDTIHLMSSIVALDDALLTLVADRKIANLARAWISVKCALSRMSEVLPALPTAGWRPNDFVDTEDVNGAACEDDPWDPHHASLATQPAHDGTGDARPTAATTDADAIGKSDADDLLFQELALGPEGTHEEEPWDDLEFGGPNEPEPDLAATSVLRDDLYPPDDTIDDLTLEIRLGRLFAPLGLEDPERRACNELLKAYDIRRLRRLLPWLASQQWPTGRLLLFLQFRSIWESPTNVRWWESWLYRSYPIFDYHILSWQATYEIVRHRAYCRPTEVINETWFQDWEEFEIWRQGHCGMMSFASFAVLRSQIPEGECWHHHVFQCDGRSHVEMVECSDRTYAPFGLISMIRLYGLSPVVEGDSTDGSEWSSPQSARRDLDWADWEVELAHMDAWIDP